MPTVTFTNLKKSIEVPAGGNLRSEALRQGVPMHAGPRQVLNCHGLGLCSSCRVNVKSGMENLKRKTWWEKLLLVINPEWMLARIGHENTMTLACQTRVNGNCEVEATPSMNLYGEKFWE